MLKTAEIVEDHSKEDEIGLNNTVELYCEDDDEVETYRIGAKEILKVYVQLYQKEITLDHIIEVVCEYLNLDFARFNSTERTREIAQARQIAMYLAKQHTKAPLTTIGAAIGGRNHATVLHSCKAVTNLIETDKAFRRQVEEIEKKVLAQ